MPRLPRLLLPDSPIVYHVISKTALDGLPFDEVDKDDFVRRLKHLARVYFTEMLGFCMMDNHFHILLCMFPADHVSDADLEQRYRVRYGEKSVFPAPKSQELRRKWSSLSEFSKERVERKLKEKMPERKERSPHAFNGLSGAVHAEEAGSRIDFFQLFCFCSPATGKQGLFWGRLCLFDGICRG